MEDLVLFWGWTRNDLSYKGLIDSAPQNWKIYTLNFDDLMKAGWIDKLSDNVLKFLDENNLDKVNLLGHSMGGALALEFAYRHPERVKRLFLLDSSGIFGHETSAKLIGDFFLSHSLYVRKKAKENFKAIWRALRNPIANLKLARYAYYIDLQKEASGIKVPTTLIWGEKDHLIPLWKGERLHKLIRSSKFIVLTEMDHDWPLHAPQLFWENI